ncbi:MAG: XrtA system polysaccharide deacetylase [Gemmatimonadaceae bacterium]
MDSLAHTARTASQLDFAPDTTRPVSERAHHFTVDVEEYFQVSAFEHIVPRAAWGSMESRVDIGIAMLLEMLAEHRARATFFVLGWLAERQPAMVTAIVRAGHEIASHGWDHRRVTNDAPETFRSSVRRAKDLLEQISGTSVQGFRAPSFSITPGGEWALDILLEEGYKYDSSLFPIRRSGYGYPTGRRDPYWIVRRGGRLLEIPPATWRCAGVNLPAGGGAYFRLLPYRLVRAALGDAASRGSPGTFYIHPWELDAEQPRLSSSWPLRIRHYGGVARTPARLRRLLREFRFTTIAETLREP